MKPPLCVVDRWAGGSLTRRPKGPFAVSWPRQLGEWNVITIAGWLLNYEQHCKNSIFSFSTRKKNFSQKTYCFCRKTVFNLSNFGNFFSGFLVVKLGKVEFQPILHQEILQNALFLFFFVINSYKLKLVLTSNQLKFGSNLFTSNP